jgi:hypothetical protein
LYVKTSESDVSKELIKEWEAEFEKDLVFFSGAKRWCERIYCRLYTKQRYRCWPCLRIKEVFLKGYLVLVSQKKLATNLDIPILAFPYNKTVSANQFYPILITEY